MICDEHHTGSGYAGFFLLAILLVVLLAVFRGHGFGHGDGYGYGHGAHAAPVVVAADGGHGRGHGCCCVDPAIVALEKDVLIGNGKLGVETQRQTGELMHALDIQTCGIKEAIGGVIANQNRVALEAERMFTCAQIDGKNEKLAELRLALAEKEARILQQETLGAIGKSNCELNHRLDQIECNMAKRPPWWPIGGVPEVSLCGVGERREPCRPCGGFA